MPEAIPGIYEIKDTWNRRYIGSSIDIFRRWDQHRKQLVGGDHHSVFLQRAFDKYGIDVFSFAIVETVLDEERLIEREQHYIDTLKPEYNSSQVAGRVDSSSPKAKEARFERGVERTLSEYNSRLKLKHDDPIARLDCLVFSMLLCFAHRYWPYPSDQQNMLSWVRSCRRADDGYDPFDEDDLNHYIGQWVVCRDGINLKAIAKCIESVSRIKGITFQQFESELYAEAKRSGNVIIDNVEKVARRIAKSVA